MKSIEHVILFFSFHFYKFWVFELIKISKLVTFPKQSCRVRAEPKISSIIFKEVDGRIKKTPYITYKRYCAKFLILEKSGMAKITATRTSNWGCILVRIPRNRTELSFNFFFLLISS